MNNCGALPSVDSTASFCAVAACGAALANAPKSASNDTDAPSLCVAAVGAGALSNAANGVASVLCVAVGAGALSNAANDAVCGGAVDALAD